MAEVLKAPGFPAMVHIPMSYVCNSECIHCPYSAKHSDIRKEYKEKGFSFMPFSMFKKAVDECGKHKALVRITGAGEMFLHPQAGAFITYAKLVGCKVGIITNGSKVDELIADIILYNDIDLVEFSVDAMDKENYERIRVGLKWDTLIKNIRYILDKRKEIGSKTRIIVSVVKQKLIEDKIDELEKFWYDFGADYVTIRKYLVFDVLKMRNSKDITPLTSDGSVPCPYPFERIEVNVNGEIKFCLEDIKSRVVLGHIDSMNIKEVWNGEYLNRVRKCMIEGKWDEIPYCRDCADRLYRSWTHSYSKVLKKVGVK